MELHRAVTARLGIEPLLPAHIDALAPVLLQEDVYRFIGGAVPSLEEFRLRTERALAGPRSGTADERWLNYLVRLRDSDAIVGRLEATLHDGLAEVAFLFGPAFWGRGYAAEGLAWMHGEIASVYGIRDFWGTTVPANVRSQQLLLRCGYRSFTSAHPTLYSYDEGDLVFRRGEPGTEI